MTQHVREGLALYGHAELAGPGEISLHGLTRTMRLGEEDFLVWAGQPPPLLDPTLQGPELTWLVQARMMLLQFLKDRARLKVRLRNEACLNPRPVLLKRIGASPPVPDRFHLRGQLALLEVLRRRVAAHAGP